jgi:hypothetical protein
MAATIAAHRGPVVWLDFLDPTTGQAAAPFPAYAGRYQQARQSFLAAEGEWPGSRSPTRSVQPGTATRAPVTR